MRIIKFMMKDWLIRGAFLEVLFLSVSSPTMKILIMRAITPQLIATRFMIGNISVILFTVLYDKFSEKIYRLYPIMSMLRIIVYTTAVTLILMDKLTIPAYYVIDIIIATMVSKSIHCCYARMKRLAYAGEDRERFDNYKPIATAVAGMIGNTFAFIGVSTTVAWICFAISMIIDNTCGIIQWRELRKR